MVWTPPVSLPDLSQSRDYSGQLYGMFSGVGGAVRQNRRDVVGDLQWEKNYARQLDLDAWNKATDERDYALELQKFEADQLGGGDEWYGTPQWFERKGADGSVSMGYGVLSKSGQFKEMPPPEGAEWAPAVTFQDTGTARVPMFTRGGSQAGAPLQIDVAGQQRQEEIGIAGGKASAALPMIEYQSEILLGSIDDVLNDPNLSALTGPAGGRLPTWLSSDPGGMSATQAKITQVVQKSFLQAYDALRGAGAITEQEGAAAKAAWTRLVTQEMSDEEYVQALLDYRREAANMLEIARQRAQGGSTGSEPVTMPSGRVIQRIE